MMMTVKDIPFKNWPSGFAMGAIVLLVAALVSYGLGLESIVTFVLTYGTGIFSVLAAVFLYVRLQAKRELIQIEGRESR